MAGVLIREGAFIRINMVYIYIFVLVLHEQDILQAVPYFFGLIVLESVLLFCQGKPLPRFNDSFSSLSNGLLSILHR